MARPRTDGTPARAVNRRKLTDLWVVSRRGGERDELVWDAKAPGLALMIRATGRKAWKVIYRHHGGCTWVMPAASVWPMLAAWRPRWRSP